MHLCHLLAAFPHLLPPALHQPWSLPGEVYSAGLPGHHVAGHELYNVQPHHLLLPQWQVRTPSPILSPGQETNHHTVQSADWTMWWLVLCSLYHSLLSHSWLSSFRLATWGLHRQMVFLSPCRNMSSEETFFFFSKMNQKSMFLCEIF